MASDHRYGVLIVGTGFAGVGLAIRLQQEGHDDFVLVERASSIGGTWRDNHYPGVACDVESHLYSYSFEPNPHWTRMFAPQREILSYLEACVDKHGLRNRIRFDTAIVSATWNEDAAEWLVETSRGQTLRARVLVSASGHALSTPIYPDIEGRETFAGKAMHSSRWDDAFALEGKRVAVIGTGASAIQIVPSIAKRVGSLAVFQRTAPWVLPKLDRDIPAEERARYERHPALREGLRALLYWRHELLATGFVHAPAINRFAERFARKNLLVVRDRATRDKLTPTFTMGCKRILLSKEYYPTFNRDNVELVTDSIRAIRERSIVTADGREREVDAIVYATGFEAAEAKPPFQMTGRDGLDLRRAWERGLSAYKGTTVAGFPNFFMMIGPNTGLGHSSMILMMESQFAYVLDALDTMKRRDLASIDVKKIVQSTYNAKLQRKLEKTVWATGGCASWYKTKDGRITTVWPGYTFEYRWMMRKFDPEAYELATAAERNRARSVPLARQ